jgi:Mo-co oxidoreductase dimerisation domain
MITTPAEGATLRAGESSDIRGVAWDGGYGIRRVQVSIDGGENWHDAELGRDVGRFAFRVFRFAFTPPRPGRYQVMAKASNNIGETQASELIFNPAGYHNNVPRPLTIKAV